MQYPYLVFSHLITLIFFLFLGITIVYFFVKVFNKKIKFLTALKAVLFYEVFALMVYFFPLFAFPSILGVLMSGLVLFLVFYFLSRKYFKIQWWKSLIVFLLITLIVFPLLSYSKTYLDGRIMEFSVFKKEIIQLQEDIYSDSKKRGFVAEYLIMSSFEHKIPLPLRVLDEIQEALFSPLRIINFIRLLMLDGGVV